MGKKNKGKSGGGSAPAGPPQGPQQQPQREPQQQQPQGQQQQQSQRGSQQQPQQPQGQQQQQPQRQQQQKQSKGQKPQGSQAQHEIEQQQGQRKQQQQARGQQQSQGQQGPPPQQQQARGQQQSQGRQGPPQQQQQARRQQQAQGQQRPPQHPPQGWVEQQARGQQGPPPQQQQAWGQQQAQSQQGPPQHPPQGWVEQQARGQQGPPQQQQQAWRQQQAQAQQGPPQQQQQAWRQQQAQGQQGPPQGWVEQQSQGQQGPPQQQQQAWRQQQAQSQQGPPQHPPQGWVEQQAQGQQGLPQQQTQPQQLEPRNQRGMGRGRGQAGQPGPQSRGQQQSHGEPSPSDAPVSGPIPKQAGAPTPMRSQDPHQAAKAMSATPSPQHSSRQSSVSKSSTASFSSSVSQKSIPPGTLGIRGEVEANYLVLNLDKIPDVAYHYDVTITPDRPKKFFRPAFKQFINTYLAGRTVAFDGVKSCYMVQMLPNAVYEGDVEIADSGTRKIQFKVSIKATDNPEVELRSLKTYHNDRVFDKPMRALQCIEVVLANACHDKGIRAGRSFFTPPKTTLDLDEGYELYTGLYQAAILGAEPYLNVDISHKSFPMAYSITEYLERVLRINLQGNLDPRSYQGLCNHLKNLKVIYNPPAAFGAAPRSYKVNDVSREPASALSFTMDDGKKMTVQQYFASRGYRLRYPNLNCVVAGSAVKPNYFPIELCNIEAGQALRRKDGSKQVQRMIRFAATSTDERKRKIMEKLQYFMHNADHLVQGFGIRVGEQFIKVPMRLLRPPSIEYRSSKYVEPRNGSWRNLPFLETGATVNRTGHKWAIVYSASRFLKHSTLQDLANMLFNGAKRMGINLDTERDIQETRNIVQTLEEYKKKKYDLVVVVIPNYGTSYADIKQKAELVCGLLTQCIKEQTLNRGVNDQLVGNLLLKVNSKLNGANHKIAANHHIVLDHVMFMGADVTHPSPDQRNIPSVVGVAASHDLSGFCYNMQYRLQESTKEEIVDMQGICRQHLRVYFKKQNCYPKSIIYYRDGVSDGQFQKIEALELGGIRAVCKELRITPKITCVIVVKRHHTRFFPTKPTGDKWNNVLPGTVVDQKIVHPGETQFFMVSHQSIQGTAKPTRYNVIVDESKMSMDDLQKMTNNLCYMFPRCNRAVSYPAPAYLAHLVAARGRVYIEGPPLRRALADEYQKRLINEQFMSTTPMFFV